MINKNKLSKYDIILIQYLFDPFSWLIQIFTRSRWNHIGLYIGDNYIFEIKRSGTKLTHISKLKPFYFKTKVIRIKNLGENKVILDNLLNLLKVRKYSWLDFYKSIWFIAKAHIWKKNFLHNGVYYVCYENICSNFIAGLFYYVGVRFQDKNPYFITPADIAKSSLVKEIK